MRIVTSFPRPVRVIENTWIPLSDGTHLAARLWLPEDAEARPVPAILEYIPYRKRDRTRERDEPMHHYFAGHGYASVRVDLRGTGDSQGILLDEYHRQEIEDALDVMRFLAEQSWCTGNIGMMGKSWGGFNALQVAARRPPELGAILTVCASDDRYADDAHYMGGCLLNENLVWGSALFTLAALPPDPEIVGAEWKELWRKRLEGLAPFAERWLLHPHRDAYWEHGSVCEDYGAISCPVYAVGGWADAYTNAIPRLMEGLSSPRKGLVGPWAHVYPHNGVPGRPIGFLQEALRWWDRWLKAIDTGIMDEPIYRVWMPGNEIRPGRWIAESVWPSTNIEPARFRFDEERIITSQHVAGSASGSWCAFGAEGEFPTDQRPDDDISAVFDLPPLRETVEILGAPTVRLRLRSDRPVAMLAARLNDVSPDGSSRRVTYGLLNLTHHASHQNPTPLAPGKCYDVELRLNHVAHSFAPGHKARLALSTTYWPIAWPSPAPVTLVIQQVDIELPIRRFVSSDEALAAFELPESAPEAQTTDLDPEITVKSVERDAETGEIRYTLTTALTSERRPALTRVDATRVEHGHSIIERFRIVDGDPLSAAAEVSHHAVLRREDWNIRVETRHRLTSDERHFFVEAEIEALEDERQMFARKWKRKIQRKLV
ncbi:MAG TPA: CocE/NonD family hydrolase [Vicinamibacteria bacterium]|nr:CocE/NonD family hydrolase [Vicinamibacteria bacterium]